MADLEAIRSRLMDFIRSHDLNGATAFLAAAFREAKSSDDRDAAVEVGELYASSLSAAGRDLEALAVYRVLLADFPQDAYLNLGFATFLTTLLKYPNEALATMAPVFSELLEDEAVRHAAIGVWGANQAILGNLGEAEKCLKLLSESDLSRIDASSIDFLLVEALISRKANKEQCTEYLLRALERAQKAGDDRLTQRARDLLKTIQESQQ